VIRTSESHGHQQIHDSSAAFRFEVPGSNVPLAPQELQIGGTSADFPKFVLHLSAHLSRTSESHGHQQIHDSSAAFRFEVPGSNVPLAPQELQIGGTSAHFPKFVLHLSAHLSRTSESHGH
jgi:hypothetical protein